jgi:hypothetical protein
MANDSCLRVPSPIRAVAILAATPNGGSIYQWPLGPYPPRRRTTKPALTLIEEGPNADSRPSIRIWVPGDLAPVRQSATRWKLGGRHQQAWFRSIEYQDTDEARYQQGGKAH